jgi:hypothetical protein
MLSGCSSLAVKISLDEKETNCTISCVVGGKN